MDERITFSRKFSEGIEGTNSAVVQRNLSVNGNG